MNMTKIDSKDWDTDMGTYVCELRIGFQESLSWETVIYGSKIYLQHKLILQ